VHELKELAEGNLVEHWGLEIRRRITTSPFCPTCRRATRLALQSM